MQAGSTLLLVVDSPNLPRDTRAKVTLAQKQCKYEQDALTSRTL